MMKVAIIGSGISGNSIAWMLNKSCDIVLYEKNDYIGGHSNTVEILYENKKIFVDTGFIVYNHKTYPNLKKLFDILNVVTVKSNMSFGVKCNKMEFSVCGIAGLFADKKNFVNPRFWKMIIDIICFNYYATKFVKKNYQDESVDKITLGDFLDKINPGKYFMDYFLLPMAGAIWSCPTNIMLKYPALSFLKFYYNHGLLTLFNQPQWFSIDGGSINYVKLLTKDFEHKIRKSSKVVSVKKSGNKIIVTDSNSKSEEFDRVIFANHPDEILEICKDLSSNSADLLANFKYQKNEVILHRDINIMPKKKAAWASWVYNKKRFDSSEISVTYWMNNLQNIDYSCPLFVTLNPDQEIDKNKIFKKITYYHPVFDSNAILAQKKIESIQGVDNYYFVGAYQGNGFHEDGIASSVRVAKLFGVHF